MSVLIKGMDTPKGCAWCYFCEHGSINEFEFFCGLTNSRIGKMFDETSWQDMRAADCPLIEVPTSHGRLIDKDELPHYTGYALSASEVAKAVEAAPTIIEAEGGEGE